MPSILQVDSMSFLTCSTARSSTGSIFTSDFASSSSSFFFCTDLCSTAALLRSLMNPVVTPKSKGFRSHFVLKLSSCRHCFRSWFEDSELLAWLVAVWLAVDPFGGRKSK